MQNFVIIVVVWKNRLSLAKLRKPPGVRIFVIGPPYALYDETNVDVYYQVDLPIKDHDHNKLFQKVREIASIHAASKRRLVVLERTLQKEAAKVRHEMDIEGIYSDELEQLERSRETNAATRRGGLTTLRRCSVIGMRQPDMWLESTMNQLGGFPVLIRPAKQADPVKGTSIARSTDELKRWMRSHRASAQSRADFVIEQCLEGGHEFTALFTGKRGLVGCTCSVDSHRTIVEAIRESQPYAIELFNTDQTRDLLPGVESFCAHTIKALFTKPLLGLVFIKGFYRSHNDITFLGISLQPESHSHAQLFSLPKHSGGWHEIAVDSLYDSEEEPTSLPPIYHCVINFPAQDGVLLHQTSIPRRRTSEMRVSWRACESQELRDSDSIDDNLVQVFLTNAHRGRMLEECRELARDTEIAVDRLTLLDRQTACRNNLQRLNPKELIRSCTTND